MQHHLHTLRGRRMDEEFKIINSPLSRQFSHDGMTVEVRIYRGEKDEAWILEVFDQEGGSTVWEEPFVTEQDALDEVLQTIATEGIGCFLAHPEQKLH